MAEQAKDFSRGKISKPLAQEIIKYINDPIARSDFEHSYDTMLDINRAHVLMQRQTSHFSKIING
jgi:argininosuccinate lyase